MRFKVTGFHAVDGGPGAFFFVAVADDGRDGAAGFAVLRRHGFFVSLLFRLRCGGFEG